MTDEGETVYAKPQTGHPFLFITCIGEPAEYLFRSVGAFKIYENHQDLPKAMGRGSITSSYFDMMVAEGIKNNPGSSCSHQILKSDLDTLTEFYSCNIQLDIAPSIVEELVM